MNDENRLWDRMKRGLDSGVDSSKKMINNARLKSRDIEEYGILKIDIKRLESRNSQLLNDLGLKVFSLFSEEGQHSISANTPAIRDVLKELEQNTDLLKQKEEKLSKSGHETN